MLADTHAHLYWDSFKDDFDDVVKRAVNNGVSYIINIGVNVATSKKALEQVKTYPWPKGLKVFSTIGIHPHESIHENNIEKLEEIYLSDTEKVIAIGECGLDYKDADEQTKEAQRKLFQIQIELAKKLNLPLIVHCRDSGSTSSPSSTWDEVLEMTKNSFGIYHCYSGLPQTTLKVLDTRFLVSFACNITYPKNDYLLAAIKLLPLERIVLETDSPFLPPQNSRGKRNEPSNVMEAAKIVAQVKNITTEEVARQTTANVVNLLSV